MKNNSSWTGNNQNAGVISDPLSFVHSGRFNWYNAGLYARGGGGNFWVLRSNSINNSNYLDFGDTGLIPQHNNSRGYGMAVRRISNML